jgi:two-component system sensor histidine kinase and response regulator WspE
MMRAGLDNATMHDLFRQEAENQVAVLTAGLLALEREPQDPGRLEDLMRAAHSLKGAARIVNLDLAVRLTHAMEDCFVAAQQGRVILRRAAVDVQLRAVDLLRALAATPEPALPAWAGANEAAVNAILADLAAVKNPEAASPPPVATNGTTASNGAAISPANGATNGAANGTANGTTSNGAAHGPANETTHAVANGASNGAAHAPHSATHGPHDDRVVRVTADHLDRLLALVGESLVESRALDPFADSLLRLKRQQGVLLRTLDAVREALSEGQPARGSALLNEALSQALGCQRSLSERQGEFDLIVRRSGNLAHRLYHETQASRMRPFADGVQGLPRLVRDMARTLGKETRLEIAGDSTRVDRDVLEKIEAPLNHLLRNAVDHGIEAPAGRRAAGKPAEGVIRIEARHSAGMLLIEVRDDGAGVNLDALREAVVQKQFTTADAAARMSAPELLEFLFLPGFTLKKSVSEFSGRGVGLDVVQSMMRQVRGTVRVTSEPGRGTRFQLQLPLTLSVVRALIVEIGGEPFAFPLARVGGTLKVPRGRIELLEGRQYLTHNKQRIGLVSAATVLEAESGKIEGDDLPVLLLGEREQPYGIAVEKFLGERELVVQALDPRLGKVKDISAGSLLPDGSPVLIVDVDDFVRSIELLISGGRVGRVQDAARETARRAGKRVLVVDDSLTVRELERKLLGNAGYEVEVAVDGMDGWNSVRTGNYDLIITDVDMPRLDGIELVGLVRKDARLKSLPVMIVSYKDREQDRQRGLDAGADYYLTKGSFHDETLLTAVEELIGEAAPC